MVLSALEATGQTDIINDTDTTTPFIIHPLPPNESVDMISDLLPLDLVDFIGIHLVDLDDDDDELLKTVLVTFLSALQLKIKSYPTSSDSTENEVLVHQLITIETSILQKLVGTIMGHLMEMDEW